MFLKKNREALQGRPKMTKGGKSATMMYSYVYSLCHRGVVATMDLSASSLAKLRTDHWLRDERNILQLWLQAPAWTDATQEQTPPAPPQDRMATWSVSETVSFLQAADLHGPAEICYRSNES
eukprot:9898497-Karenia_brevis.AAC.1